MQRRKEGKGSPTVLVGASMSGVKLPLLVIGKSKSPRCFAGIKSLPIDYVANSRACMTGEIFEGWLKIGVKS